MAILLSLSFLLSSLHCQQFTCGDFSLEGKSENSAMTTFFWKRPWFGQQNLTKESPIGETNSRNTEKELLNEAEKLLSDLQEDRDSWKNRYLDAKSMNDTLARKNRILVGVSIGCVTFAVGVAVVAIPVAIMAARK